MKTKPINPIGSSTFNEIMKTRCSNLVRFLSVLARLGKTSRRLASCVMFAAAVFAVPLQAQIVFNATTEFSITNGNPNGVWSYGWMPSGFGIFNYLTDGSMEHNGGTCPGWGGGATEVWKNLGTTAFGVPTGWLSLHPGVGEEPSVVRWTSPFPGSAHISGQFLPGDIGTVSVAVRKGGTILWQHVNSGAFDLVQNVASGENIDFAVYAGHWAGNTPLEVLISLNPVNAVWLLRRTLMVEEGVGTVALEVQRFGPAYLDVEVTVDYATVDGTAHAGEDYVAASGSLHFAPGESNKLINISILNDALKESEEQFRLVLSNPTGGVSLDNSNLVIRIQDNDLGVGFITGNVVVLEVAATVTLEVQRGDDLYLPFTVDYATVDGTAHAGADYVATSGTLHFAAAETKRQITIAILNDALPESEEQFRLGLSNPTGGVSLGNSNVTIRIRSDESMTYYVNVSNPNPVFPYTNWATAATNIQDAVDMATPGDKVLVTNGVYAVGSRSTGAEWILSRVAVTNAIRLESVNGPLVTTIDGGGGGRCVYLGSNAVLSGFTLTNGAMRGYAPGGGVFCEDRNSVVTNCVIAGNSTIVGFELIIWGDGGGAYGGTLYNCTLTGNTSGRGGGGAIDSTLYNCTLTGNTSGSGGGAFNSTLYNCNLTGNHAFGDRPMPPTGRGGGASGSTLYNCTLMSNTGTSGGGADDSTLYNCTVTGNSAEFGGGAFVSTLYNCTVTSNSASLFGGGVDYSTLYNCTVVANFATNELDATYGGGVAGGVLYNCVVYYNTATNGPNFTDDCWVEHSCTSPQPTNGVGNITGPPLFMDMAAGDFRLQEASPCIDTGTNLLGFPMMGYDAYWNWVIVGYITNATDLLGNTRFLDGNYDGTVAWDIGAYEFNPYRFEPTLLMGADGFRFTIRGEPGRFVRFERSRDLVHWEFAGQVPIPASGQTLIDPAATSESKLFYRAMRVP